MGFGHVCQIIGGLAIFLYGMHLAAEGLQGFAGGRLQAFLALVTRRRLLAVCVGIVVTFLLQSSSASTALLVSLASAGLIGLPAALAVTLGAAIGTTLTVQLIAFNLSHYALLGIAVGTLLRLAVKGRAGRSIGGVLLGFGAVFYGMHVMGQGAAPLKSIPAVVAFFGKVGTSPGMAIVGLLVATAFTAIVQSSGATLGMAMVLARSGVLTLGGAIPIIFGANIGTCATALLGSMGQPRVGKQIAWTHLFFKVAGVIVFLILWAPFTRAVELISAGAGVDRQIANAHTIFNLLAVAGLLPWVKLIAAAMRRLLPERTGLPAGVVRYIDVNLKDAPEAAFFKARREIGHMGRLAGDMLQAARPAFEDNREAAIEGLAKDDDRIDALEEILTTYLTRLAVEPKQQEEQMQLLHALKEVEAVGDVLSKELVPLAREKVERGLDFSIEAGAEWRRYHERIVEAWTTAVRAWVARDAAAAESVLALHRELDEEWQRLCVAHYRRVGKNVKAAIDTSSLYTDLLGGLRRLYRHAAQLASQVRSA